MRRYRRVETVPVQSALPRFMTADQFLAYPLPDARAELVRGEVRAVPPAGGMHGVAAGNVAFLLASHVRAHALGRVFSDGVGYELLRLPHTVRVPDASFVRADRLPRGGIGVGLLKLAPDLAVEVLSASETASELQEKLDDCSVSGTPVVWVIDPERRTVMIVAADAPMRWLGEHDTLQGGGVVPGFSCRVSAIFEGIARSTSRGAGENANAPDSDSS